jgi:hypothetical protein
MKQLTVKLKAVLADLARANAGEMLSSGAKARLLSGASWRVQPGTVAQRREVVLAVGSTLPPRVMRYAIGVCRQNDADLYVLARDAAAAGHMLAPFRDERIAAAVECRVEEVSGSGAVSRFFQRHSRALCAIVTGDDPVSETFAGRRKPPVPLVLVEDTAPAVPGQRVALAD